MALTVQFMNGGRRPFMWRFLKKLLWFKLGQKSTRSAARLLGFGRVRLILGLIGGWRTMRRHRQAHV
jgi:hypothetical protein